jgi:hypothetical protein
VAGAAAQDVNGWCMPSDPFAGPEAVLAYLSRYTHRVAIANSRLVTMDERGVTFRWKDYRDKSNPDRPKAQDHDLICG